MNISIPIKYLIGREDNAYHPTYILSAPENTPALEGYVVKVRQEFTTLEQNQIILHKGNEWNASQKRYFYMFERRHKIPGRYSKRYRYTDEEVFIMYGRAQSPTFETRLKKRINIFTKGPGKLVKVKYNIYSQDKGLLPYHIWCISPNDDTKWVYDFNYDPYNDQGKHNKGAKGYSVIEAYAVDDIAVLHKDKRKLLYLLERYDNTKSIAWWKTNRILTDREGNYITAQSPGEVLAFSVYDIVDKEITTVHKGNKYLASDQGELLRKELLVISDKYIDDCMLIINKYQEQKLHEITDEIKSLIGIQMC